MPAHAETTSRERVLAALAHREADRAPITLGHGVNAPAKDQLRKYLNHKTFAETDAWLSSFTDIRYVAPRYCGPADKFDARPDGSRTDIWGVPRKPVEYTRGGVYYEISENPLACATDASQLFDYLWPQADWFDTSDFDEQIKKINGGKNTYALMCGTYMIFEHAWYLRGFERFFSDMIENEDIAWTIMERVTDYFVMFFRKVLEAGRGRFDILFGGDDIGGQHGLLMSPSMWDRMVKPHHKRLIDAVKPYGVKVMYHTDGSVAEAVPGLIDMGVDILEALQFDAKGMDPKILKDLYGDRLCFHGGVSVQSTLPFGTREDVVSEVKDRLRVLGKGGGYICAPSHAIQAGTPPENIEAFLTTAINYQSNH
ncbi:MAG: hypothetical protein FWE82_02475 [Defluviitaleaceae bacterium]|nr:hypothetical protein [Defluviitaleaceae bacterium]